MAVRKTIERILRDADDEVGQSIREWKIEVEGNHIVLRPRENMGFLSLRGEDIEILAADLIEARDMSRPITRKGERG